jgi:polysaccharide biosynthesis/export protein
MRQVAARTRNSLIVILVPGAHLAEWTSFAAAMAPYLIGPDDVLAISVWGQKDLDQVVSVRPDGKISLRLVGEVEAGGLTLAELASRLTAMYGRTLRGAQVTVAVREIRSRSVFFHGSGVRPGVVQLTEELTILQALSAVGGPLPTADLKSVFVMHDGTRIPVDIQKMLAGDPARPFRLRPGDTIVVPGGVPVCASAVGCVMVQGAVNTSGPVEYSEGLTIATAIERAGGLAPSASGRVVVRRGDRVVVSPAAFMGSRKRSEELLWSITPDFSLRPVRSDTREDAIDRFPTSPLFRITGQLNVDSTGPLRPGDVIIVLGGLF